jgi:hypothetical protein
MPLHNHAKCKITGFLRALLLKLKPVKADKNWVKLVDNKIDFVSSSNRVPELIFPGSFNPFHSGHNSMSELAEKKTGLGLAYEICIQNADKPPLSYHEIEKTLSQFDNEHEWVLTKAGKFTDKAALFPKLSIYYWSRHTQKNS